MRIRQLGLEKIITILGAVFWVFAWIYKEQTHDIY